MLKLSLPPSALCTQSLKSHVHVWSAVTSADRYSQIFHMRLWERFVLLPGITWLGKSMCFMDNKEEQRKNIHLPPLQCQIVSPSLWIPDKPQAVYDVWSQLMLSSVAEETEVLFARCRVGLSNPPEINGGNYKSEIWAQGSAGMPREQQHKQEQPS